MPTQPAALNAREAKWQRKAVALARSRTPFAVTNFNAARDGNFYFAIRSKYQLRTQIDYEAAQADFLPSAPGAEIPTARRLRFCVRPGRSGSGVKVSFGGSEKAADNF